MTEKYTIATKDNFFSDFFYKIGHCFQCEIEGDKVTLNNDMVWWTQTIPFAQFENDFMEMSKEDYNKYMELCNEGEDQLAEAILDKYIRYKLLPILYSSQLTLEID